MTHIEEINSDCDDKDPNVLDVFDNGRLIKRIITPGPENDNRPQKCDIVCINYKCYLKDSDVLVSTGSEFSFFLSEGDVVTGLDAAIMFMNIGEYAKIEVDHRYAYDCDRWQANEMWQEIEPSSDLIFYVELISARDTLHTEFTFEDIKPLIDYKLIQSGYWFNVAKHSQSLNIAQIGMKKIREFIEANDVALDLYLKFYEIVADCQESLGLNSELITSMQEILRWKPNSRLYIKLTILYERMGLYDSAFSVISKANEEFPCIIDVQFAYERLCDIIALRKKEQDHFYKKMFSKTSTPNASMPNKSCPEKESKKTTPAIKTESSKISLIMSRIGLSFVLGVSSLIFAYIVINRT